MIDLITALNIFMQYTTTDDLVSCYDGLMCVAVDPSTVSAADKARLADLSFHPNEENDSFHSFRFRS